MNNEPCRVVVLIGGKGSNLQALIDNQSATCPYKIVGVISHRANAYGLERANRVQISTAIVPDQDFKERVEFESALINAVNDYHAELIVLAGFMRILSPHFVNHFRGKIINIHPSLLPKYKGLNTHQRVLEAKETEHGVSIHFVTEELDGGPLIAQVKIDVLKNDTVESLSERVHRAEHWLYPQVVEWFASKRLKFNENIVTLDGKPVGDNPKPLVLTFAKGIVS